MTNSENSKEKNGKEMFSKAKHKRLSNAMEINLPVITEGDEKAKLLKSATGHTNEACSFDKQENTANIQSTSPNNISGLDKAIKTTKSGGTNEETIINPRINKPKQTKNEDLKTRKPNHGYEPECEDFFDEGRKKAETMVDQVNNTMGNKSTFKHEKSIKSSTVVIPKLDLHSLSSETASTDTKQSDEAKGINAHGDMDMSTTDIHHVCVHGNINLTPRKGENLYQTLKSSNKYPKKCILCDINVASTKNKAIQTDVDKLLVEIVYPHEFYDRYSRASKKLRDIKEKEVISICQPLKVVQKPQHQRISSPIIPVPTTTPDIILEGDKPIIKEIESGEIENEDDRHKTEKRMQFTYEPRENTKTEFHGHCGNALNTLIVTEHTDNQKPSVGMKGYALHKDAKIYPKECVKRSNYNISSLGIHFSLPDFNSSLHRRKDPSCHQTPQPPLYTPRLSVPYMPLSQPLTFRQSSKLPQFPITPRNVKSVANDVMISHTTTSKSVKNTSNTVPETQRVTRKGNSLGISGDGSDSGNSSRKQRASLNRQEDRSSRSREIISRPQESRVPLALPPIKPVVRTGPVTVGYFTL